MRLCLGILLVGWASAGDADNPNVHRNHINGEVSPFTSLMFLGIPTEDLICKWQLRAAAFWKKQKPGISPKNFVTEDTRDGDIEYAPSSEPENITLKKITDYIAREDARLAKKPEPLPSLDVGQEMQGGAHSTLTRKILALSDKSRKLKEFEVGDRVYHKSEEEEYGFGTVVTVASELRNHVEVEFDKNARGNGWVPKESLLELNAREKKLVAEIRATIWETDLVMNIWVKEIPNLNGKKLTQEERILTKLYGERIVRGMKRIEELTQEMEDVKRELHKLN